MIIQCPKCHTQARLPEAQEGSKVRCSECSRIYVAAPIGQAGRAARKQANSSLPIYLGVGGVGLVLVLMFTVMGGDDPPPIAPQEPEKEVAAKEPVDNEGWNSEPVRLVRDLHRASYAKDIVKITGMLDKQKVWETLQAEAREVEPAEGEEAPAVDERTWSELDVSEQGRFIDQVATDLMEGEWVDLVANWKPYDGRVLEETDRMVKVHVTVSPHEGGVENRTVEWLLARSGNAWKAYSWKRFYTQAELAALARKRNKKSSKKTLSDGSVVYEAEPGPIEHFEDTPLELREEIDRLYATMTNLDLTRESSKARQALVDIGRPALPVLLTGLYLTPLDTDENAMKLNLIDQALRDITGHLTTFSPMQPIDAAAEERRQSGIKQWFGWYHRKANRFTENEEEDLLDTTFLPRNEREQREYEKALKELEKEQNQKP